MNKIKQKKVKIIYPFLFGFFPVLFLYSYNIEEVAFNVIFVPLLFDLLFIFLIWLVAKLVLKNRLRAGLVTFLVSFMFFSFGHFQNFLKSLLPKKMEIPAGFLVLFWILLFGLLVFLAIRTRKDLGPLTSLLNVFVIFLMIFSLIQISWSHLSSLQTPKLDSQIPESLKEMPGSKIEKDKLPDIYYLIFDRYGNEYSLKEYYDFDNSDFLNFLANKNFYVASNSRCNYPGTPLSLASSLNLDYVNDLVEKGSIKKRIIYHLLQDFKVWRLLKSIGYRYIHIGSWYEPTKVNKYADLNFRGVGVLGLSQDFILKFSETTALAPLSKLKNVSYNHPQSVLKQFNYLAQIPKRQGPKFVFLHMLMPHHPFVFSQNGELLTKKELATHSQEESYINQLIFTNKKIEELVNALLNQSRNPPIIILQSDEGPAEEEKPLGKLLTFSKRRRAIANLRIRCRILNAYYLPGVDRSVLYESISPVNTFRLIFNLYFGTNFELRGDRTYHAVGDKVSIRKFNLIPQSYWSPKMENSS
jgi:hypothetical protein